MHMRSVLFVGRRNAARSLMAETCFNATGITGWRAFSAGWQPEARADRLAIRTLAASGFPTDSLAPKPVAIFLQPGAPQIDLCVFMDETPPSDVAAYPAIREFWHIEDPARLPDTRAAHRKALDAILARLTGLVLRGRFGEIGPPLAIAG